MMWLTVGLLTIAVSLFYTFYRNRRSRHQLFASLGIPGPEPHWLYGNAQQLVEDRYVQLGKWTEQYGRTFGYYEGPVPVLYTADPDILKQVLVKDFSKFYARKLMPVQPDPDNEKAHMFFSNGKKWKRLRTISNPTFSSAKLKQMFPLVRKKTDILHDQFQEAANVGKAVDVHQLFQRFTLDVIGEVAFGMEVDSQTDPNEPYFVHCKEFFKSLAEGQKMVSVAGYVPLLGKLMFPIFEKTGLFVSGSVNWLHKNIGQVLEQRKNQAVKRVDLMQLMIDAEADVDATQESLAMTENDHVTTDTVSETSPTGNAKVNKQKLTVAEIKAMGMLFLIAGYETTSNSLAYLSYLLATNPDKLSLLHEELDEKLPQKGPLTYEQMKELTYMDMCIRESLRMYPIAATVVDRMCMEKCMVGNIPFTPGMCVAANMTAVHKDPELWGPTDPQTFCPERFLPEETSKRHPQAWLPFGGGPRNCIGMRFSLLETKLALATLLRDFTFEQCEETEIPLQLLWCSTLSPKNGVKVKVIPRK